MSRSAVTQYATDLIYSVCPSFCTIKLLRRYRVIVVLEYIQYFIADSTSQSPVLT